MKRLLFVLAFLAALSPHPAFANGMGALAAVVGYVLFIFLPAAAVLTTLTIVSAVIGREAAPLKRWKRRYAFAAIALSVLGLAALIIGPVIFFGKVAALGKFLLFALLMTLMALPPLLLSIGVLRRNSNTGQRRA